jgi:hypothetical protein
LTILSCILYETTGITSNLKTLVALYKKQFLTIKANEIEDNELQELLLELVKLQVRALLKLTLSISLIILPFLSLFLLTNLDLRLNLSILLSFEGIVIPGFSALIYFLIQRNV